MSTAAVDRLNAALSGRYRIERELGEGGMATVYLADDLRHERKVALKVLKPELAAVVGAERFLAEIKTTANLQHPHVLPLFDSGEADSFLFYVMPYVEGESLRQRLDRETQLGVEDAIALTRKVADALDYAHENGVVHRDIKPGNILLSQRGEPLVADFGIALAVAQAGGGRITETGLSLGTPHYMSPEQATGDRDVDPRSDLYALGCVLYEMLAGEPPFSAGTAQAILAKILTMDAPSITMVRRTVPSNVSAALAKSLEKLPADRFTSVAEFSAALVDEGFTYRARTRVSASATAAEPKAPAVRAGLWNRLSITLTVVASFATLLAAWGWLRPVPEPPVPTRVELADTDLAGTGGWRIEISPDGRSIVKVEDGARHIRTSDNAEWRPLANADGGRFPTFSPDGQWVAFSREGIWKVSIDGGPALPVTSTGSGPRWGSDDMIVYTDTGGSLFRVPSAGGDPELLLGSDTVNVRTPSPLPGGRGVVFSLGAGASTSRVLLLEIETGEVRELVPGGNQPRYVETGHLVYGYQSALMGVPFDLESLEVTGSPVTVIPSLEMFSGGSSQFTVSRTGTLVYRTGAQGSGASEPVWVGRDGTVRQIEPGWSVMTNRGGSSLALSPSGDRLAISIPSLRGATDLWLKPVDAGPLSRLTFEGETNRRAAWSPDRESLIFVSDRAGQGDLWAKRADGSGSATLILDQDFDIAHGFYSPDGAWLISMRSAGRLNEIYATPVGADGAAGEPVVTEATGSSISLSPDGRWLAYESDQTGRSEVYVRPFPNTGDGLVQVSPDGGEDPVWAHNGREIFYRNAANELVVAEYTADPTFTAGRAEALFPLFDYVPGLGAPMYAVSPDDERFVMLRRGADGEEDGTTYLVTGWFAELRERMGEN